RDLRACAQGNVSVRLHRLDELEGQPVAHFHGTCIDDQDISIDSGLRVCFSSPLHMCGSGGRRDIACVLIVTPFPELSELCPFS
ncbi:hypothetical protein MJL79_32330, partial [Salmonella enterica subsp. enterica serovar Montevideo]|nr:hypothetical protein [Salmonella enterica subsp. enterica serovar Montevideo]